jgi:hypothetical protein
MAAGIAGFMAVASEPVRLRRELGRRTDAVRTFSGSLSAMGLVRTRLSKNVLGGDIVGLMSGP